MTPTTSEPPSPPDTPISVRELRKRFGSTQALRGVDLTVRRGEIYGLLGPNGAGKTTLVKILLDIVRPTSGDAALLGQSSRTSAARRRVGYLPEDHRLPEYQTAHGVLDLYGGLSRVPRATRRARADELLELVGLVGVGRRKIRGYSKGMKQRLGLAQALIHDPDVLFLDEPTDGVDAVGRTEIRQALERLRERGVTILLNSHLLGDVERICDRAGILLQGQLKREGSIDELTDESLSYEITLDRPMDSSLQQQMTALGASVEQDGENRERFRLAIEDEALVDAAVDAARSAGFGIRGLQRNRRTLEDVFLQEVADSQSGGAR